jgi:hypothetical protein
MNERMLRRIVETYVEETTMDEWVDGGVDRG